MKFRHQSRAITLLKMNEKYCSIIQIYILSILMHIQNLIEIHKLIHKILSITKILYINVYEALTDGRAGGHSNGSEGIT